MDQTVGDAQHYKKAPGTLVFLLLLPLLPLSSFFTLGGVSAVPPRVPVTLANVWSGRWQEYFEANFARHFGALRPLIKLDAALDNALGETRFNSGLCGLRGRGGVLFQHDEVEFENRAAFDEAEIDRRVRALATAQAKLRAAGIAMKVLFIPTKLSYFDADLPARWRVPLASPRPARFVTERTLAALGRAGVAVMDGREIAREVRRITRASAYPREGRHFTDYTSCTILARLDPEPSLCPVGARRPARGAEDDLHRCFNELGLTHQPESLVDTSVTRKPSQYRRPLFVGSSFLRELENEARRLGSYEDLHLFYYNLHDYVGERAAEIPTGPAWRAFVRTRDLVVIDYFAPQVERLGHGFADRVNEEF